MLIDTIAFTTLIIWLYMSIWFLVAIAIERNDVADIAWGMGFVVASFASWLKYGNNNFTSMLVLILILTWGFRLSWHIFQRNIKKTEDYRYKAWRDSWGKWFVLRTYFQVFMLQGALMLLVLTPVLIIITFSGSKVPTLLIVGALLWFFGFAFEVIGDSQLKKFIKDSRNKGKIMTNGLWKYTRHPNYFGEVTQWWAVGIIGLTWPYGWLGLIGPVVITFLILKVSGVPLLENKYANNPQYQAYKVKTSMLIPLPSKK